MKFLIKFFVFLFILSPHSVTWGNFFETKNLQIVAPKKYLTKTKIIIHFDEKASQSKLDSKIKIFERKYDIEIKTFFKQDLNQVIRNLERYERYDERDYFDPRRVYQIDYNYINVLNLRHLLRNLRQEKIIDLVYPYPKAKLSSIDEVPDLSQNQTYLNDLQIRESHITNPLPNEERVYLERRTFGQRTTMILFEQSWNKNHSDLSLGEENFINDPICENMNENPNCYNWKAHGTAMAGLINGQDNEHGILGVAPEADLRLYTLGNNTLAEALGDVLIQLAEGKIPSSPILLVTQQYPGARSNVFDRNNTLGYLPAESVPIHFELFNALSAFGATVIQSAGNGSVDLNDESNYRLCNEDDVCHKNLAIERSDAIMVATPNLEMNAKAAFSNCGDRIDFFAPGINLTTSSIPFEDSPYEFNDPDNLFNFLNDDPDNYYINNFSGTSASAAIIAGVASLIQNRVKDEQYGRLFLTPRKLKDVLDETALPFESNCSIGKQIQVYDTFIHLEEIGFNYQHFPPGLGVAEQIQIGDRCVPNDRFSCDFDFMPNRTLENYEDYMRYFREEATEEEFDNMRDTGFNVLCIENNTYHSHYFCPENHIWPPNTKIAKKLDFDGDGRADLLSGHQGQRRDEEGLFRQSNDTVLRIDFSSVKFEFCRDRLNNDGCLIFNDGFHPTFRPIGAPNSPPMRDFEIITENTYREFKTYTADINSDGRSDFVIFNKATGELKVLYMTRKEMFYGFSIFHRPNFVNDWDIDIQYPLAANDANITEKHLIIQDYDNNGFLDIGLIDRDGLWKIDYNGPERVDGVWDEEIDFIAENHIPEYGILWSFFPLYGKFSPRGNFNIGYAIPSINDVDREDHGKIFLLEGPDFENSWDEIGLEVETSLTRGVLDERLLQIYKAKLSPHSSQDDILIYHERRSTITKLFHSDLFSEEEILRIDDNIFSEWDRDDHKEFYFFADYDGDSIDDIAFVVGNWLYILYSGDQFTDLLDENGVRVIVRFTPPNTYFTEELEFAF